MTSEQPTERRIVTAMAELLRARGYAGTGLARLATAADAPTGSIYHHFRGGKAEVAERALRESGAVYIELLPLLLDPHDDLAAGVQAAFAAAAEDLEGTGWAVMCPVGTVGSEVADVEPALRAAASEVVAGWVERGTAYLVGRGLAEPDAVRLIHAVLAALEGGFLLGRTTHSREPLLASGRALAAYVATIPLTTRVAADRAGSGSPSEL